MESTLLKKETTIPKRLQYYFNKTDKIRDFMYNTGRPILGVKYDNKHIFYKTDKNVYRGFYY